MSKPEGVICIMASTSNSTFNLTDHSTGCRKACSRFAGRIMNQIIPWSRVIMWTMTLVPVIVVLLLIILIDKPSYDKVTRMLNGKR